MFNNDISNAGNGRPCVALAFGVGDEHANVKRKETTQVISGYYYTQSFNKSQEYNIECDG
jgi:hypothetical protein